jgi:ssDNA thymidine ADP-ribosyltransferase, DarT
MTFDDLEELHFITPIANLPSILQHGILSHDRAEKVPHQSVANMEVQDRRASRRVPNGLNRPG